MTTPETSNIDDNQIQSQVGPCSKCGTEAQLDDDGLCVTCCEKGIDDKDKARKWVRKNRPRGRHMGRTPPRTPPRTNTDQE